VARILLGSNNAKKLRELRHILGDLYQVVSPDELGLRLDIDETGTSFAANAVLKAEAFALASGLTVLADDSGIVVDALDGGPGIHSARWGGPDASDDDRNRLLLSALGEVPDLERTARFVSAVAVARAGRPTHVFEGKVEGLIALEPAGTNGFGYDPIFFYPPYTRTFGQVGPNEKAAVSHRGQALRCAVSFLTSPAGRGYTEAKDR
jgi:XTP/dITP diphosphohydrolase